MIGSSTSASEESHLAIERRDNRIVALVMGTTVVVSLLLLYAH
jgi:hypothetical protein